MKVAEYKFYWKWIKFDIDFRDYPNDTYKIKDFNSLVLNRDSKRYKLKQGFKYMGLPIDDNEINEWYKGGWSSEHNHALEYLIELGFIKKYETLHDAYNDKEEV